MAKDFKKYNRLAIVLKELDITQKDLAERLGMTTTAMNHICTNRAQPSLKRLYEIADELNVHVFDLLVPNRTRK